MEIKTEIDNLAVSIKTLEPSVRIEEKKQKLLELEDAMQQSGFWNDQDRATKVSKEAARLKAFVDLWMKLKEDSQLIFELVATTESTEVTKIFEELKQEYAEFEKMFLLSDKYDAYDAVIGVHAGAGGDDATDWAEMLMRMLTRFCEKQGLKTTLLDISRNPAAGIKSALIEVKGEYAYGQLKSEHGVHRLVRLSPFNQAHTRETSFALIEVLPIIEEDVDVKIDDKDLRAEYTTASGHGGQSVNTTYSAVRLTHIPTGIKVSIQNERSQSQNRELAMRILKSKLQKLQEEKALETRKELRGEFKSAEWGNQIRSYVIHPYKLVKDNRTGYETSDVESVLEGNLSEVSSEYLRFLAKKQA